MKGKEEQRKVVMVGHPNVGKSLLFSRLTGTYVTVSNYPGTTVEIFKGHLQINEFSFEVIDTPGLYSLLPISEEEKVTRRILLDEATKIVVHVIDAKNIERMLPLTLQLAEAGLSLILCLNMMDEAEKIGMKFNLTHLQKELRIPLIATSAITERGIAELKGELARYALSSS